MLLQRILTALVLAPVAIAIILLPPTWLFALIVAMVFLAAQWEWTRLCGLRSSWIRAATLIVTLAAMVLLWWARATPGLWLGLLIVGLAWWLFGLFWLRQYTFAASPTRENTALKLLISLCVLIPAWLALAQLHADQPQGRWWTLLALCVVWAADIGAYFSGRAFGRRKLIPRVSPGKTRAGAIGALIVGALVCVFGSWLLDVRGAMLVAMAVLGLVTVVASIVGDLVESLMKRHADIKDSGGLFPGHGGLLDRLDSVFAALPIFVLGRMLLGL